MNRFDEWKEYCDRYAKTQNKKDTHVDNQDNKLEHGKPPSIFIVEACKTVSFQGLFYVCLFNERIYLVRANRVL
jgi:hypothetical protein